MEERIEVKEIDENAELEGVEAVEEAEDDEKAGKKKKTSRFSTSESVYNTIVNKMADIVILHFVFLVFSIPIVTIGASMSAAMYVGMKLASGMEGNIISNFWKSFKDNLKQSTIIMLIMTASGGLLWLAFRYWTGVGGAVGMMLSVATVVFTIVWLMELTYVFAVQAKFANTIKGTMSTALLMAVRHLPWTICIGVLFVAAVYLVLMYNVFRVIAVISIAGIFGFVYGLIFNKVFRNYIK